MKTRVVPFDLTPRNLDFNEHDCSVSKFWASKRAHRSTKFGLQNVTVQHNYPPKSRQKVMYFDENKSWSPISWMLISRRKPMDSKTIQFIVLFEKWKYTPESGWWTFRIIRTCHVLKPISIFLKSTSHIQWTAPQSKSRGVESNGTTFVLMR